MAKKNNSNLWKWLGVGAVIGLGLYFYKKSNNSNNTNYTGYAQPQTYIPDNYIPATTQTSTQTTTQTSTQTSTQTLPEKIYNWVDNIVAIINAGANQQQIADILLDISNETELQQADQAARENYNLSLSQIFNYLTKEQLVLLMLKAKSATLTNKKIKYPYWYEFLQKIAEKK